MNPRLLPTSFTKSKAEKKKKASTNIQQERQYDSSNTTKVP